MSEHTKTPWRIDSSKKYRVVAGKPNVDGGTVASCASYDNASSAEDNAAFIVRACNSHEALVASVEALRRRLSLDFTEASPESDNKLLVDALNALKLAKP